jgi:hypothetical protein
MAAFTAIAVGSTLFSAYQQIRAGRAEKKIGQLQNESAQSEAAVLEYNAKVADLQAQDAIARGNEEENRYRTQVRGLVGSQRVAGAASNVDVGFGSALDVQVDTARQGELDALTIRNNAAREAWGYSVQAEDTRMRAQIVRKGGKNAIAAAGSRANQAYLGAAGTILGGAANLYKGRSTGGKALPSRQQLAYTNFF